MLELHPLLFTGIVLGVFLLGFVPSFVVLVCVGRRASGQVAHICDAASRMVADSNHEYQKLLANAGQALNAISMEQQGYLREAHARYWHATRLLMAVKVPPDIAQTMDGMAPPGRPTGRRIPMRTPEQEAGVVRRRNVQRDLERGLKDEASEK